MAEQLREYLGELVSAGLESRAPAPLPCGLSVDGLIELSHGMHMDYLLLSPLLKLSLPPNEKSKVRAYVLNSLLQTQVQLRSIREIERRFEQAGIRHLFLKGAVLKQIYPHPECREMSDVDLIAFGDSFDHAGRLLEALGYRLSFSAKHHDIFVKPPFLVIELHWALYDDSVDMTQAEYYRNFSRTRRKAGFTYAEAFTEEDFYVYMISHIARHFYETGCGIRNLVDIYVYREVCAARMDTACISRELTACGLTDFEQNLRELAYAWLGGGPKRDYFNTLFDYMCSCGIYGKGENGIWSRLFQYRAPGETQRQNLHLWYSFPPHAYMAEDYPWLKGRPWLLPCAWVKRAAVGLVTNKGRSKLQLLKNVKKDEVAAIQLLYKKLSLNFHRGDRRDD